MDYGMTRTYGLIFLGVASLQILPLCAYAAGDPMRGQALYQNKCTVCHSIDYNGVGPAHKGLFGRKAGSLPDYSYSPALQSSTVVWSEQTLDKWLTNPEKFIPGQKMGFLVPTAKERADLIAYLKKATAP
jgi:cytochrome c